MRTLRSIFWCCFGFALPLCVPASGAGTDYFEPKHLTASIYDKAEGGRLLFTFERNATRTGDAVRVLREFRYPDGSLAAQERVLYERGRLMRFELDELQIGASGQAAINRGQIEFQYVTGSGPGAKRKRNVETVQDEPLTADSLGPFLAEHWDELDRGGSVKFRYLVVPRLETIGFTLTRESAGESRGKKTVRVRMTPSSWVIAKVLDPLIFTVEADPPHRVLQYWGRTTPKLRAGESMRDLDALTVFDWRPK